jgi:hypothetical protein
MRIAMTETDAKTPERDPDRERESDPKPTEQPKVNYENPAPGQPIRPSPMMSRRAY